MREPLFPSKYYQLWWLLVHVWRAIHKVRAKELRGHRITPEEAAVIFIIHNIGPATPAEISRWVLREPHSVSRLVSRMERKGLVSKNRDLARKNLVRVALTEKGTQSYSALIKIESIQRIMSVLSEEQYQELYSCLEVLLNKAFEELGSKYVLRLPTIK